MWKYPKRFVKKTDSWSWRNTEGLWRICRLTDIFHRGHLRARGRKTFKEYLRSPECWHWFWKLFYYESGLSYRRAERVWEEKVSEGNTLASDLIMFIINLCRRPTRSHRCRDELRRDGKDTRGFPHTSMQWRVNPGKLLTSKCWFSPFKV